MCGDAIATIRAMYVVESFFGARLACNGDPYSPLSSISVLELGFERGTVRRRSGSPHFGFNTAPHTQNSETEGRRLVTVPCLQCFSPQMPRRRASVATSQQIRQKAPRAEGFF